MKNLGVSGLPKVHDLLRDMTGTQIQEKLNYFIKETDLKHLFWNFNKVFGMGQNSESSYVEL